MKQVFDLEGLRVLNTRPTKQAAPLSKALSDAGGVSIPLPVMQIQSLYPASWNTKMPELTRIDSAIFTSANAVDCFFEHWYHPMTSWPASIAVFAIGPATARQLLKYNINASTPPQSDSEHLLQMPVWSEKKAQTIVLITGQNGRALIRETLQNHNLIEIPVYVRKKIHPNPTQVTKIWQNDAVDIILGTSAFVMEALFAAFGTQGSPWLQGKTWLVFSQRLETLAQRHGVRHVLVSDNAHVVETLHLYRQGLINGNE